MSPPWLRTPGNIILCSKSPNAPSRHTYETCHGMGGRWVEMHIKHEYCFLLLLLHFVPVLFLLNDDFWDVIALK